MQVMRTSALSLVFLAVLATTANGQVFVDQAQSSNGSEAFVPQLSGFGGAYVPQVGGSGGAQITQIPQNARVVQPRKKVNAAAQLRRARIQNAQIRRNLPVIGGASQASPFPTVGVGTQAIVPPKPQESFPSVRQGAVRL